MSSPGHFSCTTCGKQYRWKPELAGRKVRCKCGAAMNVPAEDPAAAELVVEEIELAAEPGTPVIAGAPSAAPPPAGEAMMACPSCKQPMGLGAVICTQCGLNLKTGRQIASAADAAEVEAQQAWQARLHQLHEREIPIALFVVAVALQVFGLSEPLIAVLVRTVVGVALMIAGAFIAARILETNFGSLGSAVLKFAAAYTLPTAVAGVVENAIAPGIAWMVVWPVAVGTFFGVTMWLFDLDTFEVTVLAAVYFVIRIAVVFVIVALLI